jgi:hypothetical protein
MKEFCEMCGGYRSVMVGFHGEIWCIHCDCPLNAAARRRGFLDSWEAFKTIVFGQAHTVIIASDQAGVDPGRVRVRDVTDQRVMIVPAQHLHLIRR